MSVYNFNHQAEHLTHANHPSSNGSNQVVRYHQADNDYLNRNLSSANHFDITRPTSKTALLVRQRRALLEQLSCYLCKGYLIDATTIDECTDSFCKSCIVIYLRSHNDCPKCGILIHKTNPFSSIRSDKVLQDIVYKRVPGLYDKEMKRRRDFYRGMFALTSSDDDEEGSSESITRRGSMSSEHYGVVSKPKPFYKPTDNIDLSIEPQTRGGSSDIYYDNKRQSIVTCFTGSLRQEQKPPTGTMFSVVDSQEFKTYLRCPAKLTALQLKRFIAAKFNICRDDTIHLLYLNESLKDEYSLIDVAYIYDWRRIEHMRLFYIIERDLSKMTDLYTQSEDDVRKPKRQSVGTSTQTVKRVCIDPHPKFYDEKNNNSSAANPNGRQMRSTATSCSSKNVSSQSTQAPILRSTSSCDSSSLTGRNAQSRGINGHSSRELAVPGLSRAPCSSSVSTAVNEPSRLNQESPKDTRSSRKTVADCATSIPKANLNLNSSNRPGDSEEKEASTYSKLRGADNNNHREVVVQQSNVRHFVPYNSKGYSPAINTIGQPQSSIVTLASFTESRSNHVVAMNTTATTTTIPSSSYRNIVDAGGNLGQDTNLTAKTMPINRVAAPAPVPAAAPQLAFSFVTERGITIVRTGRMNSHNEVAASTSSAISTKALSSAPALPSSSQQGNNMSTMRSNPSTQSTSPGTNQSHTPGCEAQASSINSVGNDSPSARHQLKVKPVYKTFVDPTKLKSPNFKKLGYTARH